MMGHMYPKQSKLFSAIICPVNYSLSKGQRGRNKMPKLKNISDRLSLAALILLNEVYSLLFSAKCSEIHVFAAYSLFEND